MLTPTEGVDFTNYLARVLASVKRNWYAVMPESARLGDRGRVVLQFRIMHNGVVPDAEPAMVGSSGKDPLDRAAVSSIRASTPFEPLPPAFNGPFIELRFIFLYNMPIELPVKPARAQVSGILILALLCLVYLVIRYWKFLK